MYFDILFFVRLGSQEKGQRPVDSPAASGNFLSKTKIFSDFILSPAKVTSQCFI